MSQFIMISRTPEASIPAGLRTQAVPDSDVLLAKVAATYFADSSEARLVTDEEGGAESVVDDVWEALAAGKSPLVTSLGELLEALVVSRIGFVLWCGDQFAELHVVRSVEELKLQLEAQAAAQPAEIWVAFDPA